MSSDSLGHSSEERLIESAYKAKFANDNVLAKTIFEECLDKYPQNAEAMRELSDIHYRNLDFEQAKQSAIKSLQLVDNYWGHLFLARSLNKLSDYKCSEEEFCLALKTAPDQGGRQMVSRFYAPFLAKMERYQEASEHATFALSFYAEDVIETQLLNRLISFCAQKLNDVNSTGQA